MNYTILIPIYCAVMIVNVMTCIVVSRGHKRRMRIKMMEMRQRIYKLEKKLRDNNIEP